MKTDYRTIKVDLKDGVAVLTIDNPPVNQMSPQLMQDFSEAVNEAWKDGQVKVVVLTGTGKNFIAGADITQLKLVKNREDIFQKALASAPNLSSPRSTATAWEGGWKRPWPVTTAWQSRESTLDSRKFR